MPDTRVNFDLTEALKEAERRFTAANPLSERRFRKAAESMPGGNTRTVLHYSWEHDSAMNKKFVADYNAEFKRNPDIYSIGGWDGMHLIYEALRKTGGKADGESLINAAKGMSWESPRGPISIDPQTRDIVQPIYIRKVEKKNGELYNVEFASFPAVKDPVKAAEQK